MTNANVDVNEPMVADENDVVEGEWVVCVVGTGYEIFTPYPHQIRKTETARILMESVNNCGYNTVWLSGRSYDKHVVIARQFIPNPNPYRSLRSTILTKSGVTTEYLTYGGCQLE